MGELEETVGEKIKSRQPLNTPEEEMRELLELAIDKGVRKFVTRAQKAGLFQAGQGGPAQASDEAAFEKQIEDMG